MSSDAAGSLYLLPNTLGDTAPEAVIPAAALAPRAVSRLLHRRGAEVGARVSASVSGARDRCRRSSDRAARPQHERRATSPRCSSRSLAGLATRAPLRSRAARDRRPRSGARDGSRTTRACASCLSAAPRRSLLALAASGLDGQRFAFHGYLPVEAARPRRSAEAELERAVPAAQQTQIFIETPYRNDAHARRRCCGSSARTRWFASPRT